MSLRNDSVFEPYMTICGFLFTYLTIKENLMRF